MHISLHQYKNPVLLSNRGVVTLYAMALQFFCQLPVDGYLDYFQFPFFYCCRQCLYKCSYIYPFILH